MTQVPDNTTFTCANCGHNYQGRYCSNCRQPAEVHRITWHELGHQLIHALFHADRGLFYTIREMTVRPGNTLRDYIKGKRIYHFNPLLFLILTGGFASFLFAYFHIKLPVKEISLEKIEHFSGTLAHKYFAVVGLIFIFLLTATDYIFYFRKKYLLPELVVSNTFQVGQILVFTIALFPLLILQNYVTQKYQVTFEMRIFLKSALLAFLFISRYQFYEAKGNYKLITKIVLQLILVFVLYNNIIAELIVYWQK